MNDRAKFVEVSKEQQDRIDLIRSSFSNMYDVIETNCKFWAIKGITRE